MKLGILGRKVGMTQIFGSAGELIPITVVDTNECFVAQVKTKDHDGYAAIQLAYGAHKPQNVTKARQGHFKKAGFQAKRHLKEIRFDDGADVTQFKAGQKLSPTMFAKGDRVDVQGKTVGKGFAGVMKRHGYHGADASHGVHEYFRHGGSNGSNTFPGRTLKLKGMPGHMGDVPRTIQNLEVVDVKPEEGLMFIKGAIPGCEDGFVVIRSTVKAPNPAGRTWSA
jgi:large subunit ribosomal protein L3